MGKQAAAIGARIRKHIESAALMLVLEIDKELRRATPVDTGHARRNWIPSVGAMNTAEAKDDSAHASGVAEVLAYKLSQGVLWVSNAVDYVRFLNYGSSEQRPAGWIERAVDIAMQKVQAKLAKAGRMDFDIGGLRAEYQSAVGGEGAENLASAYSPFGDD